MTGSPAAYGAETSLVFSTSVASGHGEGIPNTDTVTVTQGATTLCTVTLTSGSGTCSPASATILGVAGSPYTVTATFNSTGADPDFVSTATNTTTVTVNKGNQTILFTSTVPSSPLVGGTYTPAASANSLLPVALTVDTSSSMVCSIAAGVVTFNMGGLCTIDANQAGTVNFNPAAQVQQNVTVPSPAGLGIVVAGTGSTGTPHISCGSISTSYTCTVSGVGILGLLAGQVELT